jgi:hypothetical protein
MSDADKVNTVAMEKMPSSLTLVRFAQSVLRNLEAPRMPLPARRPHRPNHQRRRPQIRTQYLRHLRSNHRSQPHQSPTAPTAHNRRVNLARPKSKFNLARYHQSSAKEMVHNDRSRRQERRLNRWSHGRIKCCDRSSGSR